MLPGMERFRPGAAFGRHVEPFSGDGPSPRRRVGLLERHRGCRSRRPVAPAWLSRGDLAVDDVRGSACVHRHVAAAEDALAARLPPDLPCPRTRLGRDARLGWRGWTTTLGAAVRVGLLWPCKPDLLGSVHLGLGEQHQSAGLDVRANHRAAGPLQPCRRKRPALLLSFAAPLRRGWYGLLPYGFVTLFYWVLVSLAAYRAVWTLIRHPYVWEKTAHGLTREGTAREARRRKPPPVGGIGRGGRLDAKRRARAVDYIGGLAGSRCRPGRAAFGTYAEYGWSDSLTIVFSSDGEADFAGGTKSSAWRRCACRPSAVGRLAPCGRTHAALAGRERRKRSAVPDRGGLWLLDPRRCREAADGVRVHRLLQRRRDLCGPANGRGRMAPGPRSGLRSHGPLADQCAWRSTIAPGDDLIPGAYEKHGLDAGLRWRFLDDWAISLSVGRTLAADRTPAESLVRLSIWNWSSP